MPGKRLRKFLSVLQDKSIQFFLLVSYVKFIKMSLNSFIERGWHLNNVNNPFKLISDQWCRRGCWGRWRVRPPGWGGWSSSSSLQDNWFRWRGNTFYTATFSVSRLFIRFSGIYIFQKNCYGAKMGGGGCKGLNYFSLNSWHLFCIKKCLIFWEES